MAEVANSDRPPRPRDTSWSYRSRLLAALPDAAGSPVWVRLELHCTGQSARPDVREIDDWTALALAAGPADAQALATRASQRWGLSATVSVSCRGGTVSVTCRED